MQQQAHLHSRHNRSNFKGPRPCHQLQRTPILLLAGSYYSHHGLKLLRLLGVDMCKISVWHQLSGGDWESDRGHDDLGVALSCWSTLGGATRCCWKYICGVRPNVLLCLSFLTQTCACNHTQFPPPCYWRLIYHLGYEARKSFSSVVVVDHVH